MKIEGKFEEIQIIDFNQLVPAEAGRFLEVEPIGESGLALVRIALESRGIAEFIERSERKEVEEKIQNSPEEKEHKSYLEALATVINSDPFGGTYTGKTLEEACKDSEWVGEALKRLKNKFLLDRIKLIRKIESTSAEI